MSKSLLYHAFGIPPCYEFLKTTFKNGGIQFFVHKQSAYLCCPVCGSHQVVRQGSKWRCFKSIPIGRKAVHIHILLHRLKCSQCGSRKQEEIGFADPYKSYTQAFKRYVLHLSGAMTIEDIARLLGVNWHMIKEIIKYQLIQKYRRPKLSQLKWIAIDELYIGKKNRYLTLVMDLVHGYVVYVGDGRARESLAPFWRRLRRYRHQIEAVAMDMSSAYVSAVVKHLPNAAIIIDHFHVVKLFNEKLTQLRRTLYQQVKYGFQQKVLKGTRWLLLKNPENLNEQKGEKARLELALKLNKPLAIAYYMKEDLRQIWKQKDKETARQILCDWIARAQASGIAILKKMANTLAAYRSGILAYYDYPISTGPLEGINNKIKTFKRQAYGYRDQQFFKLKIFALHQAKITLIG